MHIRQNLPHELIPFWPMGELFDHYPDTVFFIKDRAGRYMIFNKALLSRCNCKTKAELQGKKPSEVLGNTYGYGYEDQDTRVIEKNRPMTDFLEIHIYPDLTVGWCLTSKYPLTNLDGEIIGLVGISKDLKPAEMENEEFSRISPAIDYVANNLDEAPSVEFLSQSIGLTPYQLDRRIQKIFGLTTGQWVLKQRLDAAQKQLMDTQLPIAEIALNVGYADQSAFSRQFRKTTGLTPNQFRSLRYGR